MFTFFLTTGGTEAAPSIVPQISIALKSDTDKVVVQATQEAPAIYVCFCL